MKPVVQLEQTAAAMTVTVKPLDTEQKLSRLIEEHDSEHNDILFISAGAPGRGNGIRLMSEEAAVEHLESLFS
jgi:hypothetical protein